MHDPALVVPACDCSGFVCWALGFGRKSNPAPYTDAAGWIYTDSIWADAMGAGVRFERRARATPGALVVYPKAGSGENYGHVGLVMEADADGRARLVAHCSAVNFKVAPFDAIKITSPELFEQQPHSIYAWCRSRGLTCHMRRSRSIELSIARRTADAVRCMDPIGVVAEHCPACTYF